MGARFFYFTEDYQALVKLSISVRRKDFGPRNFFFGDSLFPWGRGEYCLRPD